MSVDALSKAGNFQLPMSTFSKVLDMRSDDHSSVFRPAVNANFSNRELENIGTYLRGNERH